MRRVCLFAAVGVAAVIAAVLSVRSGGADEAEESWGGAAVDWAWRREGDGVTLVRKLAKRQDEPDVRKMAGCFSPVTQYVGAVQIPETVRGLPVRALGDSLCGGAPLLEAVRIPSFKIGHEQGVARGRQDPDG